MRVQNLYPILFALWFYTPLFAGPVATSFTQQHKILAPDGEELDFFGTDVAFFEDSILVSSQNDDDAATDSGAVYHFIRDERTGDYQFNDKITSPDGEEAAGDKFGSSMAVDADTLVIGTTFGDEAFIYEYSEESGTFEMMARLTAPNSGSGSNFGASVAVDGDTIVIGAYHANSETGAAYIFEKPVSGWTDMIPTATLTASTPVFRDLFGQHVAISGNTVVIGSHWDDEIVDGAGAAYVFEKPDTGWDDMTETAILYPTDLEDGDSFGFEVEASGDTIFVSAKQEDYDGWITGAAYVFEKPDGGWVTMTQTARLLPSEAGFNMRGSYFGHSLAFDGNILAIGAYYYDTEDSAGSIGALFLFEKPATGWTDGTEDWKLTTADTSSVKILGQSVALSGNILLAGAPGNNDNGNYSGAAYVFSGLSYSPGDVDGNGTIDLKDTIAALQVSTGAVGANIILEADVNGDAKIGLPEAISSLYYVSKQ